MIPWTEHRDRFLTLIGFAFNDDATGKDHEKSVAAIVAIKDYLAAADAGCACRRCKYLQSFLPNQFKERIAIQKIQHISLRRQHKLSISQH
jgi:hypothetical protein